MFALNINKDTNIRVLIHSIIDLLDAEKVRRDYLENILYAMLQMEEFLYIDSIIVDNAKATHKDLSNDLSKSYVFSFKLEGDILKIKEKWDKVYTPCQNDINFKTCKKCYKKERIIMEETVPLYIDTDVVIRDLLKGCTPNESIYIDADSPQYNQLCNLLIKDGYIEKFYDSFVIPTTFTLHLDTCIDNSWKDPDSIKVGYDVKLIQVFVNKYMKEHRPSILNDYLKNNTYCAISQGNIVSKSFSNRIEEEVMRPDSDNTKPLYEGEPEEDTKYFQETAKLLRLPYKNDTVWNIFKRYGYNMSAVIVTIPHVMYSDRRMTYYHISDPENCDNNHTLKGKYIKSPNDWLYTMLQLCKKHKYYLEDILCNNIECLDKWQCVSKFNRYLSILKYSYSLAKNAPSAAYAFTPIIKLELGNLNEYNIIGDLLDYRDMLRDIKIEDILCRRVGVSMPLFFWDINIVIPELSNTNEYKVCSNVYYIDKWYIPYVDRFRFINIINAYPSDRFENREDYAEYLMTLNKSLCNDLNKYITDMKNIMITNTNEEDKEKILGNNFVNTFLKRGFTIDNMSTRIECTTNN